MRKRHKPEQVVSIPFDFQSDLDAGLKINPALRKAGFGITSDYRWKTLQ